MQVVAIAGLPATGKTTLAKALARPLGAVVLSRDPLTGVLLKATWASWTRLGVRRAADIALDLQSALLREQLVDGRNVVLECVTRDRHPEWRAVARELGANFTAVETFCSDESVHRSRLEKRGGPGHSPKHLTWQAVARQRAQSTDPSLNAVRVDAVNRLEDNVAAIVRATEITNGIERL